MDSSLSITASESIVVPADGVYYLFVNAWAGISNYVLTIGRPGTTALPQAGAQLARAIDIAVPGSLDNGKGRQEALQIKA